MGFLEDDKDNSSMMRLMSFILIISSVLWGTIEILYKTFGNNDFNIDEGFIIATFSAGLSGKGIQKIIEILKK
jgi:hypothetical protein